MSIILFSTTSTVYATYAATCSLTYDIDPIPLPSGDYMVTYSYSAEYLPTGIELVRHVEIYKDGSWYSTGEHFFITSDGTYNSSGGGNHPPGSYTTTLTFATYKIIGDSTILDQIICQDTVNFVVNPATKSTWVRTMPMTCWQVWINEDNNFEFIFWWEYKNNNWVKIYDMEDKLVWEIDFSLGEPRFEVDLPDGMYTVRTFHDDFENPIQEFIIGKP